MNFFKKNKPQLSYILFEVTQQCNLNCNYCYNHWKRDGELLTIEKTSYKQASKVLKKLFNNANIKQITFTGGEPLLQERLAELILFCRMKGASVSIISNGNAGTPADISQLIQLGVQLFELPFHSNIAVIHDTMTGKTGSWQKAKETMGYISKLGGYVVPVIVITKHNFNTISETLAQLHQMGYNRIMLNRYNIGGKAANNPGIIAASKEELNHAFLQADTTGAALKLTLSSNVCTPHCVVDPNQYRNIVFTNCTMDVTKRPLTLTATGELRFCNHSPSVLGNIFNEPLPTILKNSTKIGSIDQPPAFCDNCAVYDKCLGGCRAAAEQVGNSFSEVDPIVTTLKHEL